MKIGTLNLNWSLQASQETIEAFLDPQHFDFLILTEAVHLNLHHFPFSYFSEQIPENVVYEDINYSEYLPGAKAFRTIIYSKIPAKRTHNVTDKKTSLALEFETELGDLLIYATIIGTQYRKKPFAKNELENCIIDCRTISDTNPNLLIIGDLNTSFLGDERQFSINSETTASLKSLFKDLNLINATENITQNIDHIIIPNFLAKHLTSTETFVEKDILSDHKGICVSLNKF